MASQEKLGAASPYVLSPLSKISGLIVEVTVPYRQLGLTIVQTQRVRLNGCSSV